MFYSNTIKLILVISVHCTVYNKCLCNLRGSIITIEYRSKDHRLG